MQRRQCIVFQVPPWHYAPLTGGWGILLFNFNSKLFFFYPATRFFLWLRLCFLSFLILAISWLNWGQSSDSSTSIVQLFCPSVSFLFLTFSSFSSFILLVSVYAFISIYLYLSFFLSLSMTLYPSSSHLHQIFS